eukprot:g205.t1
MGKKSKKSKKSREKAAAKKAASLEEQKRLEKINLAMQQEDVLSDFQVFTKYSVSRGEGEEKRELNIKFYTAQTLVEHELNDFCFDLIKENMQALYDASEDMPWSDADKRRQLSHDASRFFVVSESESEGGKPVACVNFRFEIEGVCPVLYVYDLQTLKAYQSLGIGKHLMRLCELVGRKQGMDWVMLTVFKANEGAMRFYMDRMKYGIDETSPSMCYADDQSSYQILSKCLDPALRAKLREEQAANEVGLALKDAQSQLGQAGTEALLKAASERTNAALTQQSP